MNKYLYPFILISTFTQFALIYYSSQISTYQLGIFSLINAFFVITIPTARFDGSFLYISKLISKDNLKIWSKSTNSILSILIIITCSVLFINSFFLALALILLNFINLYINWSLDLKNPEMRLKTGYNEYFKKDQLINQIIYRFSLQILLLFILIINKNNFKIDLDLFLKIFIFLEIIILSTLSILRIGINSNFFKTKFPPYRYFINILLGKAEASMLPFGIAFLFGINTLGVMQLATSFSRTLQISVIQFLRFEYVNLFSKVFLNKVIRTSLITYSLYIIYPILFIVLEKKYQFLNYDLDLIIFIFLCLYSGNRNTKNLIQHLGLVFSDVKNTIKFSLGLIFLNMVIVFALNLIKNIYTFSLSEALFFIIIFDLVFTLRKLLNYFKANNV